VPTEKGLNCLGLRGRFFPFSVVWCNGEGEKCPGLHFPFPVKKIHPYFQTTVCTKSETRFLGALRKKKAVSNLGRMYPMKVHFGSDEFDASRPPSLVLKIL